MILLDIWKFVRTYRNKMLLQEIYFIVPQLQLILVTFYLSSLDKGSRFKSISFDKRYWYQVHFMFKSISYGSGVERTLKEFNRKSRKDPRLSLQVLPKPED